MKLYTIYSASEAEQALILSQIPLIGQLQEPYQQKTLDAYATALKNSTFPSLADAPFSRHSTHYRLLAHINEVAEAGLMLADFAYSHWPDEWTKKLARQELLQILLLHDLDKYLLLSDESLERSIAHGTLSAMILNDLGFDSRVIEAVASHSPSASLHLDDPASMILHYCDLFSCDHIYMLVSRTPHYCMK